jgi:hypothetical protein
VFAPAVQVKVGAKETPVAKFAGKESVGQVASVDNHAKRIFGRLVVDVPVTNVEEQTFEASALYHRDHVPVPKPAVVH